LAIISFHGTLHLGGSRCRSAQRSCDKAIKKLFP
jgi:hypothetical protein